MALFIGLRGNAGADSPTYSQFFTEKTTSIWNWQELEKGYAEYGFYYLSVLIKSICNNVAFYFLSISLLTLAFLFSSINKFSIYPILGFCVYYARFLIFRDMNQIRASLAILIVIYALSFLVKQDRKKYICLVLCAATLHYSACIALCFVFLYNIKVSTFKVVMLLLISALIGVLGGALLKHVLISSGLTIFLTYVNANNLGIVNPVILFQSLFCILFVLFEKRLSDKMEGYFVLRNAYLFSTVILLLTSNLGEIGGRISTLFATCEIFIIPAIIYVIRPRIMGYILILGIISFIFYLNYQKIAAFPEIWTYHINL